MDRIEEPRIYVGGEYRAGGAHLLGQPDGHRATTSTDLKVLPAGVDQLPGSDLTRRERTAKRIDARSSRHSAKPVLHQRAMLWLAPEEVHPQCSSLLQQPPSLTSTRR
jgi:hypothetical protein